MRIRNSTRTCATRSARRRDCSSDQPVREDRSVVDLLTAELLVRERAARAALPDPERVRQPLQARHVRRRRARRPARSGQHPDRDVVSQPHVAGAARPLAARQPARRAAAAAAARRARAERERRRQRAACRSASRWKRTARIRRAPSVTCGWIRSGSRSRTSTRSASGARRATAIPVDASASLPDGSQFRGRRRAAARSLPSHHDDFARTFTQKLLAYALGAVSTRYDLPAVRAIAREASRNGYRWSSIILGVATSTPFTMSTAQGPRAARQPRRSARRRQRSTMLITKKAIPRRTVLRGIGATLALPLLDAMVPALTALQKTAAKPINRFGVMYVPNGMIMEQWTPAAEGAGFELTPTLAPLAPFHDRPARAEQSRLRADARTPGRRARQSEHAVPDRHLAADQRDLARRRHLDGSDPRAGRRARSRSSARSSWRSNRARRPARATSASRAPTRTRSPGAAPNTPLPTENNPRVVFERLFGDSGSTDPQARQRAHPAGPQRARFGPRGSRARCRARSARATASSSSSISTRFATSSGASRRPRSRAARSCRASITRPASPPPTTTT